MWHEPDQEYLTTCAEYPGLSYLDADPVASFQGFLEVVKGAIALTLEEGLPVPEPIQTRTFNGKVALRISQKHRSASTALSATSWRPEKPLSPL
ncbi:MAG: hypothetical protein ACO1RX_23035 [Candidatus Sericytochromatia bacterium]